DALAVKEMLAARRRAATAAARRERAEPPPRARVEEAQPPPEPAQLSAVVATYLSGDVRAAITRAASAGVTDGRAARMARELRELDQAYRDGLARMEANKPIEAMRSLDAADKLDRTIARGKESRIGAEVRRALSRLHYQAAAASMSSDEALPRAAQH